MNDGVGRRGAFPCAPTAGLLLLAAGALLALSGCTGSGSAAAASRTPISTLDVRWWASPGHPVGSAIGAGDAAAATALPSDPDAYCAALAATAADGTDLFSPGVDASSAAYARTVHTFVAEVTALAPAGVHDDWMVLGPVVDAVAASGGDPTALTLPTDVPAAAVSKANAAITAQAKRSCGVKFG